MKTPSKENKKTHLPRGAPLVRRHNVWPCAGGALMAWSPDLKNKEIFKMKRPVDLSRKYCSLTHHAVTSGVPRTATPDVAKELYTINVDIKSWDGKTCEFPTYFVQTMLFVTLGLS